jgi:hypothetical protein
MIMKLLTETRSHDPWTKGEITNDRKIENEKGWVGKTDSTQTDSFQLVNVDYGVSVGDDLFPNFKEEINV